MPEYLAPGVYLEEGSSSSKPIEAVLTSTTGFAGMARYGPVQYEDGPRTTEPRLVTSFSEFERIYGGLAPLVVQTPSGAEERLPFLGHAARAFFLNGGKRLYVSRVFVPASERDPGVASLTIPAASSTATWRARWPGSMGNVCVEARVSRTQNVAWENPAFPGVVQAQGAKAGAVVEIFAPGLDPFSGDRDLEAPRLAVITVDADGLQSFTGQGGTVTPAAGSVIQLVELDVKVRADENRADFYSGLGAHPKQERYIGRILQRDNPEDQNALVWLDWNPAGLGDFAAADLIVALQQAPSDRLHDGNDGALALSTDLLGSAAPPDHPEVKATGLEALGEIDEIAIVALPDSGTYADSELCAAAADVLIDHAERLRYRIAVVDAPQNSSITEIREFRGRFDSAFAALYHPWVEISEPSDRVAEVDPPRTLVLPPSGFITGVYARNDTERGVHKAPADRVVRGLTKLELDINGPRQDLLNPEGINCLRFFRGRGTRVCGARTLSSEPEWKYVNVRRLVIFIEHSIDRSTQWAVFEPNDSRLWAHIRRTAEDFLLVLWRDGALVGEKPEEAYFVRCDRTTMTQNDLDNGRLVCVVGIAPTKPAEFLIFRIAHRTVDARK